MNSGNATARVQDQVISELGNKGHKLGRVYKYKYTPYIAMTVDSATLDALLSSPDVISVEEDMLVSSTLNWSVPRIGANSTPYKQCDRDRHDSGNTGHGRR